jgi:hypothetical protein
MRRSRGEVVFSHFFDSKRPGDSSMATNDGPLPSWNDTSTRDTILRFVESVTTEGGPNYVRPQERIATFDNDGTLWCEKPMPIQLDFILRRLVEMAEADSELRQQQPWKAAYEKDYAWLSNALVKHYRGDGSDLLVLMNGIPRVRRHERRAI